MLLSEHLSKIFLGESYSFSYMSRKEAFLIHPTLLFWFKKNYHIVGQIALSNHLRVYISVGPTSHLFCKIVLFLVLVSLVARALSVGQFRRWILSSCGTERGREKERGGTWQETPEGGWTGNPRISPGRSRVSSIAWSSGVVGEQIDGEGMRGTC